MNYIKSERENILLVHLAPPCGTCSAATSKRHKSLEAAGYNLPKPLRSKEYPMGLPSLRGLDAAKVTSANALYEVTFQIASSCIDLQLTVSIENPENSLFWDAVPIQGPLAKCNGHHNVFQSWMIGGDRDKQTKWSVQIQMKLFLHPTLCATNLMIAKRGHGCFIRRSSFSHLGRVVLSSIIMRESRTSGEGKSCCVGVCTNAIIVATG